MKQSKEKQFIRKKSHQAGFGLVEVVVSITIMAMVMIALNYLAQTAYYSWENASNKVVAYNLIQKEIEQLHNLRDSNSVTAERAWDEEIESVDEVVIESNEKYSKTILVDELSSDLSNQNVKKKVTVIIKWNERLGERSMTGITYLTDWKPRY